MSLKEKLHLMALDSVKEDSIDLLIYLLDINKEFYDENCFGLQELYILSRKTGSIKSSNYLYDLSIDSGRGLSLERK